MEKILLGDVMRISYLNACCRLNKYFHFLNLQVKYLIDIFNVQVEHLIDKMVKWVFITLPELMGQKMSVSLWELLS